MLKSHARERRLIITQPARWSSIVSTVFYLVVAAGLSLHCYRYSMFDIDLLGYAGSIALAETGDIVKAHHLVYEHPLTAHLRGLDDNGKQALELRRRAADPYYAAQLLPYFAVKPFYIVILEAVHKLGFTVIDSSRAVSTLFYFGIAVMLWMYTRSWLSLLVMVVPEVMLLGQANEPDGMSCFFLLLGLWLVFLKRRDIGLLPLVVAIWVRPENLFLALLVIFVLLLNGRLDVWKAVVLALLCVGSDVLINHYGYSWQDMYHHGFSGEAGSGNSFALGAYARSAAKGLNDMLHSPVPLFMLLWMVCFPLVGEEARWVMGTTLVFSAMRFLIFPPYEPRYYPLFFVTTALAAVLAISRTPFRQWLSPRPGPAAQG